MHKTEKHLILSIMLKFSVGIALSGLSLQMAGADDAAGTKAAQDTPGAAQPAKPEEAAAINEEAIDAHQPLRPGFVINVSVVKEKEPSGSYTVNAAGNILIKIAEMTAPISLAGQTPEQAAAAITAFLKTYIRNPLVTVSIVEVPRSTVTISGAVKVSGPISINSTTTLAYAISRAEWNENADLSQVRIARRKFVNGEEKLSTLVLHLDAFMRPAPGALPDDKQNPFLQDRDSIFVPYKSLVNNGVVTVAGAVIKPQTGLILQVNPPLRLIEAISLSGGLAVDADRHRVTLRRAGSDTVQVIDLDRAEEINSTFNLALSPNDSIYVGKLEARSYYTVTGGVTKAGHFPLDKPTTLTQAVIAAGGMAPYARDKSVYIIRNPDGAASHTKVTSYNWPQILAGKAEDVALKAGDSIWIAPGSPPARQMDLMGVLSALTSVRFLVSGTGN